MKFLYSLKASGLALILLSISVTAHASALDALMQQLNSLQSARADFVQTVMDGRGQIIQQTRGQMTLQRPGRFRWQVKTPGQQLLVADGQRIWFYDIDLQQVMIQHQQTMGANSPAALLSASTNNLANQFNVKQLANGQGFQLLPKDVNALFHSITLVFQGDQLREMRLFDKLGQQTTVDFSHFEKNPILSSQTFHFVLPKDKNVEVVKG